MSTTEQLLIAGGGIGGMAAAFAVARAGWDVRLYERASGFGEFGAGAQLGPNATRILRAWGMERELTNAAAFPERRQLRNAVTGGELGALELGARTLAHYGAPHATIHRSDLHLMLCMAAGVQEGVHINLGRELTSYADDGSAVTITTSTGLQVEGEALLGADGIFSRVRQQMLGDGAPRFTGRLAYCAMLAQAALPQALRSAQITEWLGPHLYVVQYSVRCGELMNLVAIVPGQPPADEQDWDDSANTANLQRALGAACTGLRDLIEAAPSASINPHPWLLWPLAGRPPVQGAHQLAQGRIALLGDAAHPLRPWLAQDASMAVEDAAELARALSMTAVDVATRFKRYALARWQRVARVQTHAQRSGQIFHAAGPMRLGRDASMRLLGERVLDAPWLYGN